MLSRVQHFVHPDKFRFFSASNETNPCKIKQLTQIIGMGAIIGLGFIFAGATASLFTFKATPYILGMGVGLSAILFALLKHKKQKERAALQSTISQEQPQTVKVEPKERAVLSSVQLSIPTSQVEDKTIARNVIDPVDLKQIKTELFTRIYLATADTIRNVFTASTFQSNPPVPFNAETFRINLIEKCKIKESQTSELNGKVKNLFNTFLQANYSPIQEKLEAIATKFSISADLLKKTIDLSAAPVIQENYGKYEEFVIDAIVNDPRVTS